MLCLEPPPHSHQQYPSTRQTSERVSRLPTDVCESTWAVSLNARKNSMTARLMAFCSSQETWLHNPAVARGQSKKLHRPWTGPYRIVHRLSDAVYRFQHTQARRQRPVVHFDRLKPCPPDMHLSEDAPQARSRGTTPTPAPPLGSALEFLESPDPDPSATGPHAPPTSRYPRRDCSAPD